MPILSKSEIREKLDELEDWATKGNGSKSLMKTFEFPTFKESILFVNRIADLAEQENHYPSIVILRNTVTLTLATGYVGGVTELDFRLAKLIDRLSNPDRRIP